MNSDDGGKSAVYWMLIQSIYSLLENPAPALKGIATQLVLQVGHQKAILLFYQASCYRMMRKCWEVSYLIRNNAAWNTMMEDKAHPKFADGSFDRSIACRKDKTASRISLSSSKDNKTLLLP